MTDAFVFRAPSIPFVLLSVGLLTLVVAAMLIRGDLTIRTAFASAALMALPWAAGHALTNSLNAPRMVELFARISHGCLALVGPALMFVVLAMSGLLARHRLLIYGFTILGAVSCLSTWTTTLVIDGVWQTRWGIWHPRAGVLFPLYLGLLFASISVGVILGRRATRDRRDWTYRRYFLILWITLALCFLDMGLYYGIGVYPLSAVPALGIVSFTVWSLLHRDLLHARGRGVDWGAVWELALFVLMIPLVAMAAWAASERGLDGGPVLAALLLVPLYGTVQIITLIVRSYLASESEPALDSEAEQALEEFGELVNEPDSEAEIGELLAELLGRHSCLIDIVLYLRESPGRWNRGGPGADAPVEVATQLEAWLYEQQRPVSARDVAARRLGKLREPLAALFDTLGADVLVPLSERGALVAAVAARLPEGTRHLDDSESHLVGEAARLAARALVYIGLFREAMERIEMARELEVAMASQVTREPGEQLHTFELCEVAGYHQAAKQVGGGWWTCDELDDGRVLVVVADVTGHGVPAALVSAAAAGARETALRMRGVDLDVVELLELLDQSVRTVDVEQRYSMRCFAALFDRDRVSFASAGHPAPWLCRGADPDQRTDELHPLDARGTPLGTTGARFEAAGAALAPGDIVVLYSPALVDATGPEGERYGERRFQRFLQRHARAAGERICRAILDDVLAHRGGQPITEDVTVVAVSPGRGRSRRRAPRV